MRHRLVGVLYFSVVLSLKSSRHFRSGLRPQIALADKPQRLASRSARPGGLGRRSSSLRMPVGVTCWLSISQTSAAARALRARGAR